jgi:hypothetical protein
MTLGSQTKVGHHRCWTSCQWYPISGFWDWFRTKCQYWILDKPKHEYRKLEEKLFPIILDSLFFRRIFYSVDEYVSTAQLCQTVFSLAVSLEYLLCQTAFRWCCVPLVGFGGERWWGLSKWRANSPACPYPDIIFILVSIYCIYHYQWWAKLQLFCYSVM